VSFSDRILPGRCVARRTGNHAIAVIDRRVLIGSLLSMQARAIATPAP
jgi:hypothetical protein